MNELGFQWRLRDSNNWDDMVEKLKEYRDTAGQGSCNVPQTSKKYPKLGRWVQNQRADYRAGKLSGERIQKLESVGFQWSLVAAPQAVTWEEMFQRLSAFQAANGHCNVPGKRYKQDPSLGIWVESQRRAYKGRFLVSHLASP